MGVLKKIAKEMEKLEHRTETVTDQSELHRMIDEAMTNVRKLVTDGLEEISKASSLTEFRSSEATGSIVITPEGIERLEAIVRSLRSNTKEIGEAKRRENDSPRVRNLCVMVDKSQGVATGNADRLEFLINEAKGLITPGMYPTPDSGPSASTPTSTEPSSTTKSSGSTSIRSWTDMVEAIDQWREMSSRLKMHMTGAGRRQYSSLHAELYSLTEWLKSAAPSPRSTTFGDSTSTSSGKTKNLAEDVNPIANDLVRLELAVATPEGQTLRSNILHALRQLQSDLYKPKLVAEHFMNVDITVDEDIFDLWTRISGHIQDEAKADYWGDAQRIHLTEVCEQTLDALASAGGSDEQKQQLLMKAISEPDFDKTEKVEINVKAPWLKDPERVDLKERIRVGKKHGGKNILTTIKEAEAFLECSKEITALAQHLDWDETQTPLQYLWDQVPYKNKALNKAYTNLLKIREIFEMGACPDEMIVEEARAIVAKLAETMKKNEHVFKIIYRVRSEEQDRLDGLTSLGYEALDSQDRQLVTEQDGVLIGIERVLKALGDKSTIAEEEERKIFTTIELAAKKAAKKAMIDNSTPCSQPEMREMRKMLAFIAGAFRYVQVAEGGLGSVKRLTDYAKRIGLIE